MGFVRPARGRGEEERGGEEDSKIPDMVGYSTRRITIPA